MKGIWLKSPCVSSGAGEIVSSSHGQVQLNGAQLNPVQQQTQMSHQQMPTPNMAVSNNTISRATAFFVIDLYLELVGY